MWSLRTLLPAFATVFAFLPALNSLMLPEEPTPTAYHLKIDASNLTTSDTYSGSVLVNMTIGTSPSYLLLHSDNLTIYETSAVMMKKHSFIPGRWDAVNLSGLTINDTLLNVSFYSPLANADHSLYIEFKGYYQSSMSGFAKVGYHFNKQRRYLGVTGLAPGNVRKVFPCFHDMGHRTKISLEITIDDLFIATSNVKFFKIHSISDTTKMFEFKEYPAMPINQLSWAVLDAKQFPSTEDNSTSVKIRTRAPYLYLNQTTWSNTITARLVEAVGVLTEHPFNQMTKLSHPKIEHIVLPEFIIGTSEGFSFTSFSEESILVSPKKSSTKHIQDVSLTLSRLVVQQWFGHFISMDSWQNNWLMKGLDEYFQYVITEHLPEMLGWELGSQMVVELTQKALAMDSAASHPLSVVTEDETLLMNAATDSLTRYKAGSLIRMLRDVVGSTFKTLLNWFINSSLASSESNPTTPSQFWSVLYQLATDANVDLAQKSFVDLMDQWVKAPGYPTVSVTSNNTHFNISQSRTSQWWVPITYSSQGSQDVNRKWLKPGSSFTVQSSAKWILINLNQTGYYRVNYTSELWQGLSRQLSADLTVVQPLNRAQLIDDAFASDPVIGLKLTGYLRSETDYFPWVTALRNYETLINFMHGQQSHQLLQDYILNLMNGVISEVGFSSKPQQDSHITKLKRSLVLEKACLFGHPNCIEKAVINLRTWIGETYYDPDLSPALLCAGVANSSDAVWQNVWSKFQLSLFPNVRLALLKSLTCTKNKDLLYQFLNNITSRSNPVVSVKDKTILLQTMSSTPFGADVLLSWLVNRLQDQTRVSVPETPSTTPIPESSTPEPMSDQPKAERLESNSTSESVTPTSEPMIPTLRTVTISVTVVPTENITESDVRTILNLISPMLTTFAHGEKLDKFLSQGNITGLSPDTLTLMKKFNDQIYTQSTWASQTDAKLARWLITEGAGTATSASGTSQTPGPSTTPEPSSAPHIKCSTLFLPFLLATWLQIINII